MLRRHAHGWAWKCHHCGQFASSETAAGKYVCRSHGGVTARQRDPEVREAARQAKEAVPRPPGRPLESGWYTRRAQVRVDEIVADYQARQLKADSTDEDMLYLRAYLQEMRERRPDLAALEQSLDRLTQTLEALNLRDDGQDQQGGGASPNESHDLLNLMQETRQMWKLVTGYTAQLEKRHAQLIRLSKLRAETRLKDSAAQQLDAFTLMLSRLMVVLQEQLSAPDFAALQARMARDLAEVPADTLSGGANIRL